MTQSPEPRSRDARQGITNLDAMLEDLGHKVFEANSARQALSLLREDGDIDLVVTDHAMPQMTGLDLIREIKRA